MHPKRRQQHQGRDRNCDEPEPTSEDSQDSINSEMITEGELQRRSTSLSSRRSIKIKRPHNKLQYLGRSLEKSLPIRSYFLPRTKPIELQNFILGIGKSGQLSMCNAGRLSIYFQRYIFPLLMQLGNSSSAFFRRGVPCLPLEMPGRPTLAAA